MRPVPVFPKKRPLELDDKPLFDGLFKKFPPQVSEFTFTNLFAWRHTYHFFICRHDDVFLIVSEKEKTWSIFDPIGPLAKKESAMRRCLKESVPGYSIIFVRIPQDTVVTLEKDGLEITEDPRNSDYLYLSSDLIGLKGKKYDAKRNFIKRFGEAQPFKYMKCTKANIRQCVDFQEEWCLAKDCQHVEGLAAEKEAMQEMLVHFDALGIQGGMIEIAGKVEAVTLGEPLNPETFVIHIEKANGRFIGIYQAINQMFAADAACGYRYINREQDLGVAGLIQSKGSYHPWAMVKKYKIVNSK